MLTPYAGRVFRILVVCTANICRSPATETLLRREVAGLTGPPVAVSSAGTAALDGSPACDLSSALVGEFVARHYVSTLPTDPPDPRAHRARRVTEALVADADLILALDRSHRAVLARLDAAARPRTFTLRQAAGLSQVVAGYMADGQSPPGAPPMPVDATERLRWWVGELDAARGTTGSAAAPSPPAEQVPLQWHSDDVPDPHVIGYQIHGAAIELAEQAVLVLSAGMKGVVTRGPDSAGATGERP